MTELDSVAAVMNAVNRVQALGQEAKELLLFMLVGRMSVENIDALITDIGEAEELERR